MYYLFGRMSQYTASIFITQKNLMNNRKSKTASFSPVLKNSALTLTSRFCIRRRDAEAMSVEELSQALKVRERRINFGSSSILFLSGHLSDKYGRKTVLTVGIVLSTFLTWMIGPATNAIEALVCRLVSGLWEGIFWPVAMAAVASYFRERVGLGCILRGLQRRKFRRSLLMAGIVMASDGYLPNYHSRFSS